jgi:hypothetical protein
MPPDNPETWRAAVWWFVPLGLLMGLAWAGVFRVSWRAFGEVAGLCPLSALAVVLLDVALLGYGRYWGLARVVDGIETEDGASRRSSNELRSVRGILTLVVTVLATWTLIVALPKGPGYWPSDWRETWHLNELYPRPVFRPLILAPMWGCWAMLLAAIVGRARPEGGAVGLCAVVTPIVVLAGLFPVVGITTIYCSRRGNRLLGLIVGLIVLAVTHILSAIMGRRCRGQSMATLFAAGKAAELTFLLVYLALVSRS